MKTIGLIGGMSWESSLEYYRIINEGVKTKIGRPALRQMYPVFGGFRGDRGAPDGGGIGARPAAHMIRAREKPGAGGRGFYRDLHQYHAQARGRNPLQRQHSTPAYCRRRREIRPRGEMRTVGLLGTRYTMEEDFHNRRLAEKHGLKILIPDGEDRGKINRIIFMSLSGHCKAGIAGVLSERHG